MALDVKLNIDSSGTSKAKNDLNQVGKEARQTAQEIDNIKPKIDNSLGGQNVSPIVDKLGEVDEKIDDIGKSSEGIKNLFDLDAIAQAGAQLSEIGNKLSDMSAKFAEVAQAGVGASQMLHDMMQKRGEGGQFEELDQWASKLSMDAAMVDDVGIKKAAAGLLGFGLNAKQIQGIMPGLIGQSRLYGQSLESVASQLGRAFASGNIGGLARTGITIPKETIDRIKDISDEGEKQKAIFAAVQEAMQKYALGMTQGMSQATIAANRAANAQDAAMVKIGKGSRVVERFGSGIKTSILVNLARVPGLAQAAGFGIAGLGVGFRVIGGAMQFTANAARGIVGAMQIWQTVKTWLDGARTASELLTSAQGVQTVATGANTVAAGANTVATTTQATAAGAATVANQADAIATSELSVAQGAAATTAGAQAAATTTVAAATAAAGTAATGASVGFLAMAASAAAVVAPFLAIAAAAAVAMVAIDKLLHRKEDAALKENIAKGDVAGAKLLEMSNKKRAAAGLPPQTQEEFDRDGNGLSRVNTTSSAPSTPTVMPAIAQASQIAQPTSQNNEIESLKREIAVLKNKSTSTKSNKGVKKSKGTKEELSIGEALVQATGGMDDFAGSTGGIYSADGSFQAYDAKGNPVGKRAKQGSKKVTLKPKTKVSQASGGNWIVEILPEKFVIPNDFAREVGKL